MSNSLDWLPPLILLANYGGDWDKYLQALYSCFEQDFVKSRPSFRGTKLGLKRHPIIQGKEATFWHLISEGRIEDERDPDMRRCERIGWPRPIINDGNKPTLKAWSNERNGEKRICLWLEEAEYLVILADRSEYILLWTAYVTSRTHTKRKLQKEYEAFKKAGAAL